jgi:hypothetical protein
VQSGCYPCVEEIRLVANFGLVLKPRHPVADRGILHGYGLEGNTYPLGGDMAKSAKDALISAAITAGIGVAVTLVKKIDLPQIASKAKCAASNANIKRTRKKDVGTLIDALRAGTAGTEQRLAIEGDVAIKALDHQWCDLDLNSKLRGVTVLEMIGDDKALLLLIKVASSDDVKEVKQAAEEAIQRVQSPETTGN